MLRIFFSFFLLLVPFNSFAITLEIPVDCEIGKECFLQNYVDTAPGGEYRDYKCGLHSYDGHKGTDFRVANLVKMREGVPVIAAAEGRVRSLRDGMSDVYVSQANPELIKGRDCGNGVVVDHVGDWQTQYCHLKKGSVAVRVGDVVKAGDKIGEIGLSGRTEFPHLHLSVRKNKKEVDPFTGLGKESGCDVKNSLYSSLWSEDALNKMPYTDTVLLGMGFAGDVPDAESVRDGKYDASTLAADSKVMLVWVDMMGVKKGDELHVVIKMPNGKTRGFKNSFDKFKAQMFYYTGVKLKGKKLPKGDYRARAILLRGDKKLFNVSKGFVVN